MEKYDYFSFQPKGSKILLYATTPMCTHTAVALNPDPGSTQLGVVAFVKSQWARRQMRQITELLAPNFWRSTTYVPPNYWVYRVGGTRETALIV